MSIARSIMRALVVVTLACPIVATATTINFSSLSQAGSSFVSEGTSYIQQGFTFASGSLYAWEASSLNLPGLSPADTSLFEFFAGGNTSITAVGNAPFTLDSVDLAPLIAGGSGTFDVTFTGTHADLSTVSQTFTVSDSTPSSLTTFHFSDFTNVVKVSFTQGTNIGFYVAQDTGYQFDNLVLNSSSTARCPNPVTFRFWLPA